MDMRKNFCRKRLERFRRFFAGMRASGINHVHYGLLPLYYTILSSCLESLQSIQAPNAHAHRWKCKMGQQKLSTIQSAKVGAPPSCKPLPFSYPNLPPRPLPLLRQMCLTPLKQTHPNESLTQQKLHILFSPLLSRQRL